MSGRRAFTKAYVTEAQRATAQRNHEWLSRHAGPMVLPSIVAARPKELTFERVDGRHAELRDLKPFAEHLGTCHGTAWRSALHKARLTTAHVSDGHVVPGFITRRAAALNRRLEAGHIASARALADAVAGLDDMATRPAAFYKDTNPRNILITEIERALTAYNSAASAHHPRLGRTAPYVGRGGYRWPWTRVRPTHTPRRPTCT